MPPAFICGSMTCHNQAAGARRSGNAARTRWWTCTLGVLRHPAHAGACFAEGRLPQSPGGASPVVCLALATGLM